MVSMNPAVKLTKLVQILELATYSRMGFKVAPLLQDRVVLLVFLFHRHAHGFVQLGLISIIIIQSLNIIGLGCILRQ